VVRRGSEDDFHVRPLGHLRVLDGSNDAFQALTAVAEVAVHQPLKCLTRLHVPCVGHDRSDSGILLGVLGHLSEFLIDHLGDALSVDDALLAVDEVRTRSLLVLLDHPHLAVQALDTVVRCLRTLVLQGRCLDGRIIVRVAVRDEELDDVGEFRRYLQVRL